MMSLFTANMKGKSMKKSLAVQFDLVDSVLKELKENKVRRLQLESIFVKETQKLIVLLKKERTSSGTDQK
jgi:hypothetical protein